MAIHRYNCHMSSYVYKKISDCVSLHQHFSTLTCYSRAVQVSTYSTREPVSTSGRQSHQHSSVSCGLPKAVNYTHRVKLIYTVLNIVKLCASTSSSCKSRFTRWCFHSNTMTLLILHVHRDRIHLMFCGSKDSIKLNYLPTPYNQSINQSINQLIFRVA